MSEFRQVFELRAGKWNRVDFLKLQRGSIFKFWRTPEETATSTYRVLNVPKFKASQHDCYVRVATREHVLA